MTEASADKVLKFMGDKIVPLILIVMGGIAYKSGLPEAFAGAVGGAGLLAFQTNRTNPANPPQPQQGANP